MDVKTLFDVSGKTALVTGGSAGIGYMIAEGLVRAGVRVTVCSRKAAEVEAAAERLRVHGDVTAIPADLTREADLKALTDTVNAAGPLNILVNNAGATWGAPIEAFPRTGFEKVLNLNLLAPFEMIRLLLPALRAAARPHDPARVINISSIAGLALPSWENYPYSATKAGLIQMSRHLGKELAPSNISVNTIAPGFFPSRMTSTVVNLEDPEEMAAVGSPLGARVGTPEDIAGAVLYLSSRAGAWLSGVTLPVSGGHGLIE